MQRSDEGALMTPWSEMIRDAMTRRGVKVPELAESISVHQSTVYGWRTGKQTPTGQNLRELAAYLEMDFAELATAIAEADISTKRGRGQTKDERIADLERQLSVALSDLEELRNQRDN
jgi:transcriptional regulator with XRE-family HTH domain